MHYLYNPYKRRKLPKDGYTIRTAAKRKKESRRKEKQRRLMNRKYRK
jgi:hypothetical protein